MLWRILLLYPRQVPRPSQPMLCAYHPKTAKRNESFLEVWLPDDRDTFSETPYKYVLRRRLEYARANCLNRASVLRKYALNVGLTARVRLAGRFATILDVLLASYERAKLAIFKKQFR